MNSVISEMSYIENAVAAMQNKKVVFWGAGRRFKGFIKTYCKEKNVLRLPDYVCDSTRELPEKEIDGIPVISFDELKKFDYEKTIIVITAGLLELPAQVIPNELYYFPIYHCRSFETYSFLKENSEEYRQALNSLSDDQSKFVFESVFKNTLCGILWNQYLYEPNPYFGNNLIGKLKDDDHFVFAGAFNGKHIDRALSNNSKIHVSAFEPNKEWYEYLVKKYENNKNVRIRNKVLWYKEDKLKFDTNEANSGLDAHVLDSSAGNYDQVIEATTVDLTIKNRTTLIALDVEGSEQKAVRGAEKTILRDRPNLAICLYHQHDDFIKIPLMLKSLDIEKPYKLFVKQHSCLTSIETVLYAV